jgi:transcriptional regulator with XRE-family HTH domain
MATVLWRVRRAALGFRQSDVAARVNISQARYSLLERGELTPTEEEVRAIDAALTLPKETAEALLAITVDHTENYLNGGRLEQKPKSV